MMKHIRRHTFYYQIQIQLLAIPTTGKAPVRGRGLPYMREALHSSFVLTLKLMLSSVKLSVNQILMLDLTLTQH
jgi:hypothetical protein